ncbi:MAG: zinc ribbon domain-containing protein [Gammaproteobacteria bacterium]
MLNRQARAVNFVWNYCNDTQKAALKWNKPWPTGFDLNRLTAGSSKELGLSSFRNMLAFKSIANGARYEDVDECFSSQVCSSCGSLPDSRPKGIADLAIRQWVCSDCGVLHDRDVNAALNLLARSGHRTPAEGIPAL